MHSFSRAFASIRAGLLHHDNDLGSDGDGEVEGSSDSIVDQRRQGEQKQQTKREGQWMSGALAHGLIHRGRTNSIHQSSRPAIVRSGTPCLRPRAQAILDRQIDHSTDQPIECLFKDFHLPIVANLLFMARVANLQLEHKSYSQSHFPLAVLVGGAKILHHTLSSAAAAIPPNREHFFSF